jgi:hypothetical protein
MIEAKCEMSLALVDPCIVPPLFKKIKGNNGCQYILARKEFAT